MAAGHAWISQANVLVVYNDYGISEGMKIGIAVAQEHGIPIVYRSLSFGDLMDVQKAAMASK